MPEAKFENLINTKLPNGMMMTGIAPSLYLKLTQ